MTAVPASPYRTHAAGTLNREHAGQTVTVAGWVQTIRRFRRQSFVELREASGLLQLVVPADLAEGLTEESTLQAQGQVAVRHAAHPHLASYPTGEVELQVQRLELLGKAGALPFARHETPSEAEMLRHRTLALRWPAHQSPLVQRARIVKAMRQVAEQHGFLEVETPVLVRNTPGGATPFLVPVGEGKGYALAQSPQVWKQLLVCGGIERYYQLAHCFRNEGARPERQPEFSQFEIEMAFSSAGQVQAVMEGMVQAAATAAGKALPAVFPRSTYLEAMARFGSDKPHAGNPLRLEGPVATVHTRFERGEVSLTLPRPLTRTEQAVWLREAWERVEEWGEVRLLRGDQSLVIVGPRERAQAAMGALRTGIAEAWGLVEPGLFPVWVEQFPLWEQTETGAWASAHHPFTRPLAGHTAWEAPETMLGEAFDLAINGQEIGGGSMRIHEPAQQRQVFALLGWGQEESEAHFQPLLEALSLGAPPHGGMALGVERLVATLLNLPHIRAAMAFPKTSGGQCLLTGALAALE